MHVALVQLGLVVVLTVDNAVRIMGVARIHLRAAGLHHHQANTALWMHIVVIGELVLKLLIAAVLHMV